MIVKKINKIKQLEKYDRWMQYIIQYGYIIQ